MPLLSFLPVSLDSLLHTLNPLSAPRLARSAVPPAAIPRSSLRLACRHHSQQLAAASTAAPKSQSIPPAPRRSPVRWARSGKSVQALRHLAEENSASRQTAPPPRRGGPHADAVPFSLGA